MWFLRHLARAVHKRKGSPSYHGGQLGDHVTQCVDVALIPRVSFAQIHSQLAELHLARRSMILEEEKHTAQDSQLLHLLVMHGIISLKERVKDTRS